jgi:uncharacterized lipoprotein YmbA
MMKRGVCFWKIVWACAVLILLLGGCRRATIPEEFYTLNALNRAQEGSLAVATYAEIAIGVGPLDFPEYLDRPQIVTRTGPNRLALSEFHRWGGSLDEEFLRVLAENISIQLGTDRVAVFPWGTIFNPTYRVKFDVHQFDGTLGETVLLNVTWTITGQDDKAAPVVQTSIITEPVSAKDYEALVAAKSRALAALSRRIVEEIKRLETK